MLGFGGKVAMNGKYGIDLMLQLLIFVLKRIDRRMGKRAQRKMDIHAI